MLITIEISNEEISILKENQVFRMNWIIAGMDEKEPLDFIHQKIINAVQEEQKDK